MAEPEVVVVDPSAESTLADIDMSGADEGAENAAENGEGEDYGDATGLEDMEPEVPARVTFLEYVALTLHLCANMQSCR